MSSPNVQTPTQPPLTHAPSGRAGGERLHFPGLDVIRVLAATLVAHHHFFNAAWFKMEVTGLQTRADLEAFAMQFPHAFKFVFLTGRWVIQAFLFLSAFTLTLSALQRDGLKWGSWYRSRLLRIYPPIFVSTLVLLAYWSARSLIQGPSVIEFAGVSWSHVLWNALGMTFLADVDPMVGAWWFNGLILSYYLVFPLLLWTLKRIGPTAFLTLCLVGQLLFFNAPPADWIHDGLRSYQSDFIGCRILELAFGMCLAERVVRLGPGAMREWTSPVATLLLVCASAACFWILGTDKQPITVEPVRAFLFFLTLYALFCRLPKSVLRLCARLAGPAMIVYLIHHPLVEPVADLFAGHFERELLFFLPFIALCFLISIPIDRFANAVTAKLVKRS